MRLASLHPCARNVPFGQVGGDFGPPHTSNFVASLKSQDYQLVKWAERVTEQVRARPHPGNFRIVQHSFALGGPSRDREVDERIFRHLGVPLAPREARPCISHRPPGNYWLA